MDSIEHGRRMQYVVTQMIRTFEEYKIEMFELERKYYEINARLRHEREILKNTVVRTSNEKTIKDSDAESITEDVCAICMDPHKKIDTVLTSCNHTFGKQCFTDWLNSKPYHLLIGVSCPICKHIIYNTTSFKKRKCSVKKTKKSEVCDGECATTEELLENSTPSQPNSRRRKIQPPGSLTDEIFKNLQIRRLNSRARQMQQQQLPTIEEEQDVVTEETVTYG